MLFCLVVVCLEWRRKRKVNDAEKNKLLFIVYLLHFIGFSFEITNQKRFSMDFIRKWKEIFRFFFWWKSFEEEKKKKNLVENDVFDINTTCLSSCWCKTNICSIISFGNSWCDIHWNNHCMCTLFSFQNKEIFSFSKWINKRYCLPLFEDMNMFCKIHKMMDKYMIQHHFHKELQPKKIKLLFLRRFRSKKFNEKRNHFSSSSILQIVIKKRKELLWLDEQYPRLV